MPKNARLRSAPVDYSAGAAVMPPRPYVSQTRTRRDTKGHRISRLHDKPFVVWDGEGARADGKRKPQNYVLLGYYDGIDHEYITSERLGTFECLEFIIQAGRDNPDAWHVGFAFGYDTNMIVRSLTPKQLDFLNRRGFCRVSKYRIEHVPGKWFRVTEYGSTYSVNKQDKITVTIFDIWGFFQASFLSAIKTTIPDHPMMSRIAEIEAGKAGRKSFTYDQLDFITEYWKVENVLLFGLINRLREMLYSVGLYITKWHGPGALASYVYTAHNVKAHKSDCGSVIYDAARYGYAGGRFERYHIGRFTNAYSYDINSAYPNAIARLPSLSEGSWSFVHNPRQFAEFGLYRVRLRGPAISRKPSPLFHRDIAGNITYPWRTDGWYWSPELKALAELDPDFAQVEIVEGWEYTGWRTRPFAFVQEMYDQRREMKAAKNGAQMALKLALNSLYGKMAQRAGWERTGEAPTWHQLEWAGWVTSYTRAMLWRVMATIPYEKLIAVETDGLYTTATPDELGIHDSKLLGEWEVNHYDELVYLQSGVYAKREGSEWEVKYRGLDRDSFGESVEEAASAISSHAAKLLPLLGYKDRVWPPIVGTTTRFVGYRNALFREAQGRGPMKVHHCVWESEPREISCGSIGKRIHSPRICAACRANKSAFDMPHETIIKSRAMIAVDGAGNESALQSHQHEIPWLDEVTKARWREMQESREGLEA